MRGSIPAPGPLWIIDTPGGGGDPSDTGRQHRPFTGRRGGACTGCTCTRTEAVRLGSGGESTWRWWLLGGGFQWGIQEVRFAEVFD